MQGFPKCGHRKAPLLKDLEVVFPHICEKYSIKEEAREYLGEEVYFHGADLSGSLDQEHLPWKSFS